MLSQHGVFMKSLDSIWEIRVEKICSKDLSDEEEQNDPCVNSLP